MTDYNVPTGDGWSEYALARVQADQLRHELIAWKKTAQRLKTEVAASYLKGLDDAARFVDGDRSAINVELAVQRATFGSVEAPNDADMRGIVDTSQSPGRWVQVGTNSPGAALSSQPESVVGLVAPGGALSAQDVVIAVLRSHDFDFDPACAMEDIADVVVKGLQLAGMLGQRQGELRTLRTLLTDLWDSLSYEISCAGLDARVRSEIGLGQDPTEGGGK